MIDSGRYIFGPEVQSFEHEFARYVGAEHAVGVGNGTDALMIALRAVGVEPGDDVVVPIFTFYASAEAIAAIGARPGLLRRRPRDLQRHRRDRRGGADPEHAARSSPCTCSALPAPVPRLRDARRRADQIVEDAAQAAGATARRRARRLARRRRDVLVLPVEEPRRASATAGSITTGDEAVAEQRRACCAIHGTPNKQQLHAGRLQLAARRAAGGAAARAAARARRLERRAAVPPRATYEAAGIAEFARRPQTVPDGADPVHGISTSSARRARRADRRAARARRRGARLLPHAGAPAAADGRLGRGRRAARHRPAAAARNIALPISPVITPEQVEAVVAGAARDSA